VIAIINNDALLKVTPLQITLFNASVKLEVFAGRFNLLLQKKKKKKKKKTKKKVMAIEKSLIRIIMFLCTIKRGRI
jgi:hypothetical protein